MYFDKIAGVFMFMFYFIIYYFTDPKKIQFRTGESSVLYEINSQSFISGLQDLLASKMFRNYLDKLTQKAAFVYRAIRS